MIREIGELTDRAQRLLLAWDRDSLLMAIEALTEIRNLLFLMQYGMGGSHGVCGTTGSC